MIGTITNVAIGSGLKIFGYVAGRLVDGFFETMRLANTKTEVETARMVQLYGGDDTAGPFTLVTRRAIAWAFAFTGCFVLATAALNVDWSAIVTVSNERTGLVSWIWGNRTQATKSIAAEVIFMSWSLLEVMFGFYFTKVGKKS
jgi:hypothetical protein